MSELPDIATTPPGWTKTTLGEVREKYSGSVNPEKAPDQTFEHYSVPSFDEGKPVLEPGNEIGSSKKQVEEGMVLLCKINPRINRVWTVENHSEHPKIASTEWIRFPRQEGIFPPYLCYYMRQHAFRNYLAGNVSGVGGSLMRAKKAVVDKYPLLLPPLPEQRRIVAKIEELSSALDAGVADLKKTQKQLQRYRQSVLQAAVEGRLTKDWRKEHPGAEPANKLLERILEERQAQWEKDYRTKYEAKGKEPPSGWKSRYKPPEDPDTSDLEELPEGWIWTSLGQAFDVHVGSTPRRSRDEYWNGDILWANSSEVNKRQIETTEETITEEGLENSSTDVHPAGTLLLGMIGQGPTRGMVAKLNVAAAHSQNSAAIRVSMSEVPPMYVYYYLESSYQALRQLGSGNNQKALNKGITESIPIPLPPVGEQRQIVNEVERLLSVAEEATQIVEREIKRAERLRQSILKQAFSGQLVEASGSPDSAEEPAPVTTSKEGEQIEMLL